MPDPRQQLATRAAETGESLDDLLWRHTLEGMLRRLARSPHADALVLRGGLRTRMLVAPAQRPTRDLDFLALFDREVDEAVCRLGEVASVPLDDGVAIEADSLLAQEIWQETEAPGIRLFVRAGVGDLQELQIDLGFGDPLVPPAEWVEYPALLPNPPARVLACRAETLVGWKLHGLFEHGLRRWRLKDLYDLLLLTVHTPLEAGELPGAIRAAFTSRSEPPEGLRVLYDPGWWGQGRNTARWEKYRREQGGDAAPADLPGVVSRVAENLRPALAELLGPLDVGDV
jgi:hypothetical protein